jgi:tetratricopeptide (TPR) repeat protein
MKVESFEIEGHTPFSESMIWQLNRDFYQQSGINAWSDDIVPHHMTSNAKVGQTYAELIFAFLKDLGKKGQYDEKVYILELGAGHGRLAFHLLKHLQILIASARVKTPSYCYVLTDIVEDNLTFFQGHSQFQYYLEQGILDVSYFDALESQTLYLRNAKKTITPQALNQPVLAIANYFFDSLPNDLFFIHQDVISACSVAIHSKENPEGMNKEELIKNMDLSYHRAIPDSPIYEDQLINSILEEYRGLFSNTYVFFPRKAMSCLYNLKCFSKAGLMVLTMDKGFHELHNLKDKKEPDIVTHGSFSLWVNYHALNAYCSKQGGKVLFPVFSNFHLEIGCLLFVPEGEAYQETAAAYQQFVNDFGPDDFNSIKRMAYSNVSRLQLKELIALFRLSAYDSTFFIKMLPRLKQVYRSLSFNERRRLAQVMDAVWDMYFHINETFDLAYEIGGILYDLGYYTEALAYFQHSIDRFGEKADIYYNQALCYYQLRQDKLFHSSLKEGKEAFPDFDLFKKLESLEME